MLTSVIDVCVYVDTEDATQELSRNDNPDEPEMMGTIRSNRNKDTHTSLNNVTV